MSHRSESSAELIGALRQGWEADGALAERLDRLLPGLIDTMAALYGDAVDFEGVCHALIARMQAAAQARPAALQTLDRARAPGWFATSEMLGYSAYVDRFAGTLSGIAQKIPYLCDLGIRYLHLLPFWDVAEQDNDGGFAVRDYEKVRPALGTIDDLDALCTGLRGAGISLCVDLVLNHTSDQHAWARAAREGDAAFREFYHIVRDQKAVDAYEAKLGQVFPRTAPGNFTYVAEIQGWVWTTFYPFQWDLNYANPAVFAQMVGIVLDLANRGVDAFRLDSAAYVWKQLGTDCRSLPQAHWLMRALRAVVAIVAPAVALKSEVIAPVVEAARYFGNEAAPECHLAYHAGLMSAGWAALAEQNAELVRAVLQAGPPPPANAAWVSYVRCHDDIGWQALTPQVQGDVQSRLRQISDSYTIGAPGQEATGAAFQSGIGEAAHGINGTAAALAGAASDQAAALPRLLLLYGLAFSVGGLPVINMGDELGQLNDVSYLSDPARAHEGRWLHRPIFDQAAAARRHDQSGWPGQVFAGLQALIAARRHLPAARPQTAPIVQNSGTAAVLAFSRGPEVLVLLNFSSDTQIVAIERDWAGARDLLSGRIVDGPSENLPGHAMLWLIRRD